MQKTYNHLTRDERVSIRVLSLEGLSMRGIARRLSRDASTISREFKRNKYTILGTNNSQYLPPHAQSLAKMRRSRSTRSYCRLLLKSKKNQRYVEKYLKRGWSPETISGRMKRLGDLEPLSHEAIYQWIYKDRSDLIDCLVRHHKTRKRRGQRKTHRSNYFDSATPVSKRPVRINKRKEFGHWESDSMLSDQSLSVLHVAVERKTRYAKVTKLKRNRAIDIKEALISRMRKLPAAARSSFTYDRGYENSKHTEVNASLGSDSYFCSAYSGWEKGTVENTIGVIRRTIPKKTDLAKFSTQQIRRLEFLLNNRPRKCLDFRTPTEVFNQEIVALQC